MLEKSPDFSILFELRKNGSGGNCMVFLGSDHSRKAQASTEFLIAMGAVLIVALTAAALSTAWPDVLFFTQQQRADQYWSNAHPFSVNFHTMKPDNMVMEIRNTDPTTLTISAIWLEGVRLDFYNHTVPFTTDAYSRCNAGVCNMTVAPGGTQFVSTANFTTSPANPCGYGADFKYGAKYEMALVISYYGKNVSSVYNQTAVSKLIGTCGGYGGCMSSTCCGGQNQICCEGSSCNDAAFACSAGLCVPCGNVSQPCCSGSACPAGNLTCLAGTCQCGNTGLYCCNGTTCTNASNICNATTTACVACGNTNLPCCTGNSCSNASNMCNTTSQVCRRCGTAVGDLCCSGEACTLGANLTCNQSATPQHTCVHCGNTNETCCPPSNSCSANLNCSSGTCQCGGSNQACCSGTTCNTGYACNTSISPTPLCQPCGALDGQLCCLNLSSGIYNNCTSASLSCNTSRSPPTCYISCGDEGAACCPDGSCTSNSRYLACNDVNICTSRLVKLFPNGASSCSTTVCGGTPSQYLPCCALSLGFGYCNNSASYLCATGYGGYSCPGGYTPANTPVSPGQCYHCGGQSEPCCEGGSCPGSLQHLCTVPGGSGMTTVCY